jgi:hypothetical protein
MQEGMKQQTPKHAPSEEKEENVLNGHFSFNITRG